jgi:formylglycine-generating enzyme
VGDAYPVYSVSWYDAVMYANKLSQRDGLRPCYTINGTDVTCNWSANGWRLPTEAEWEYAARGGSQSKGYTYAGSNDVDAMAWYTSTTDPKGTQPVGMKIADELGLYDMSGNVSELCWDWYGIYTAGSQTDPRGVASGSNRVIRGGNWLSPASGIRSVYRSYVVPSSRSEGIGFRLARPSSR